MADTNQRANRPTPLERAEAAVIARYPNIYRPGIKLILDAIPGEVFHELGDQKRMVEFQTSVSRAQRTWTK